MLILLLMFMIVDVWGHLVGDFQETVPVNMEAWEKQTKQLLEVVHGCYE